MDGLTFIKVIPESEDEDPPSRKSHYVIQVSDIVCKYLETSVSIINALRIDRKKGKTLLTKDILGSPCEKATVLHDCTKLRSSNYPVNIRKIYITPDLTSKEQKINKNLRAKLADINKDGKHYRIKKQEDSA